MIIPIGDINKRHTVPFVNYALLAANVAAFFLAVQSPRPDHVVEVYALVPARWELKTLITSMFLHADLWHLFGNMLFLWIAGDNVEDRLGHGAYVVFYLAAGVAGSLAHVVTTAAPHVPTIGASGAISGVLGAYLVFFPTSRIKFLVLFFMATFTAPSWNAILLWLVMQGLLAWESMNGATTNVAVLAHLGGFAFGFAVALILRLFGKERPKR
ncbi:MAG: rhomboid family intramembrane serine protease [Planctomycetes bacterium]|nr:rhomboid family intramembrane serine protease [Planctomycetota bacterium]